MNVYTVARATRGFGAYLLQTAEKPSCAIAYDSRNMSQAFARLAALELAEKGIKVYLYRKLAPTPMLSYAVRHYGCNGGIVITASHNPGEYNGYKVYGPDGCQLTVEAAGNVAACIEKEGYFTEKSVCSSNSDSRFDQYLNEKRIEFISEETESSYLEAVMKAATAMEPEPLKVVYSPLNGTGNIPVRKALERYLNLKVFTVREQELPDGSFPTCPYPNPEIGAAMELAARLAEEKQADFFLATDPDCDRVGVGAVTTDGEKRLFTGNEIGVLLFDYICGWRKRTGTMPGRPVAVKTIVTTPMADAVAAKYRVELRNVLTGFKFIGEQIGLLEKEKEEERFIFGFEESCGYLSGTYVRDKDGVNGAVLICEMAAFHKSRGKDLLQALEELYSIYGYYENKLLSYEFSGVGGKKAMDKIMADIRNDRKAFPGGTVKDSTDYLTDDTGLPKSNVISLMLEDGSRIIIRPSGTEPKLKLYLMVKGSGKEEAASAVKKLASGCNFWVNKYSG
ncbi:MAG: phospho-sugar mutase [Lacrimispora sp.]